MPQHFDTSELDPQQVYQLLTHSVQPRPIAWISTLDQAGTPNLAPYSFFTVASVEPPVLAYSQVTPRTLADKDTLANLRAGGDCVVNLVTRAQAEVMNASCAALPHGQSEFDHAGVAPIPSRHVAAPGVAGSPLRIECRLRQVVPIGDGPMSGSLVLLDVVAFSVDDAVLEGGLPCPVRLDAVGKLGGDGYSTTRDRFELARP